MSQSKQVARLSKLAGQSQKFMARLRVTGRKRYNAPPLNGQVYQVTAGDAKGWNDLGKLPAVYLMATDSDRVHVVLAPRDMAGDAPDCRSEHHLVEFMPAWLETPGVDVTLDARYLREAIHPAADAVVLRAPQRAGDATLVTSFLGGKQIALAIVAPPRSTWRGSPATVWPPVFAGPADAPATDTPQPAGRSGLPTSSP